MACNLEIKIARIQRLLQSGKDWNKILQPGKEWSNNEDIKNNQRSN